jgi:serine/threonine protein kinase
MIHHYATWEVDNAFHVIFPWADGGNLKEYWKTLADKERTPDLGVWALRQMLGLSEALAALHIRNCRHGDLKPDK